MAYLEMRQALKDLGYLFCDDEILQDCRVIKSNDGFVKFSITTNPISEWNNRVNVGILPLDDHLTIRGIEVAPLARTQGRASYALQDLVRLADKLSITLQLEATPYGKGKNISRDKLMEWYRKFGFVNESPKVLIRTPKVP